jgi:hypothetical protein
MTVFCQKKLEKVRTNLFREAFVFFVCLVEVEGVERALTFLSLMKFWLSPVTTCFGIPLFSVEVSVKDTILNGSPSFAVCVG